MMELIARGPHPRPPFEPGGRLFSQREKGVVPLSFWERVRVRARHVEEPHPACLLAKALLAAALLLPRSPMLFSRQYPHVFTNNPKHHFVRTTADGREPAIAIRARNGIIPGVTHTAPKL